MQVLSLGAVINISESKPEFEFMKAHEGVKSRSNFKFPISISSLLNFKFKFKFHPDYIQTLTQLWATR